VGGWLLVFCLILVVLKPLGTAVGVLALLPALLASPTLGGALLLILRVVEAALGLVAGTLLWTQWRYAAHAAKAYLVFESLLLLCSPGVLMTITGIRAWPILRTILRLLFNLAWFIYFCVSQRVKATFPQSPSAGSQERASGPTTG